MSSAFEVGEGDEQDLYAHMWDDVGDDWGFDHLTADDWAIWNSGEGENTVDAGDANEPSSSITFHTASSPPPRLSPQPRRHTSASGVNDTQQSQRPMGANLSAPSFAHNAPTQPSSSSHSQPIPLPRRRRAPTPAHRDDWLDPAATRRSLSLNNVSEAFFHVQYGITPPSFDSDDFDDAIDIDDILSDGDTDLETDNMAPQVRNNQPRNGDGIVDLTNDSSPSASASPGFHQPRSMKRSAEEMARGQVAKRRKGNSRSAKVENDAEIEQLDLTNEAPSAEEELAQAQTAAAIFAQQSSNAASGPLKIGQRQCIICMESFTNITITHCGHIYCHECLTQALLAGEKNSESGKANCPVCRKQVNRKTKNHVIPLSFMTKSAFQGKARRRMPVIG